MLGLALMRQLPFRGPLANYPKIFRVLRTARRYKLGASLSVSSN